MKTRKMAVLIGLFACALLALGLAACQPEHQHTFSEEWAFDATHHWHEVTCEHSGEKGDYAEHTWNSGTGKGRLRRAHVGRRHGNDGSNLHGGGRKNLHLHGVFCHQNGSHRRNGAQLCQGLVVR